MAEKYSVSTLSVEQILSDIKSGIIAIPEIQRPFVWKAKQVRDLMDSLYTGYPTGYLIISQSPNMKLKDGSLSEGKKIMIDGQQRVTAMMTAIIGQEIVTADFQKKCIKISFNPLAEGDEEAFKVQDSSTARDKRWIADISTILSTNFDSFTFVQQYCALNPNVEPSYINSKITQLNAIKNRQIGIITLDRNLTVDEVTEIFVRINSQGAILKEADFVMSKIAANEEMGGNTMRKAIDYFSHLAIQPEWYAFMEKDEDFMQTEYALKLKWLKDDRDDIYDPDYSDILRVSFLNKFHRGKLKDLVSLLSGRDFETREYKKEIAENSFATLKEGVMEFINEFSFKEFVLAMKAAGFVKGALINSQMTLDFAYTLYLYLRHTGEINRTQLARYVAKWFVMSTLTRRYIGSPETMMDMDIRRIMEKGFLVYMSEVESSDLSDNFWNVTLPMALETSVTNSPFFNVFIAAQIHQNSPSFLMNSIHTRDLVETMGDVHHIFPKAYLRKSGFDEKSVYNQIANYVYLDTTTNIAIGEQAPCDYFAKIKQQCESGIPHYGDVHNWEELMHNLDENCIPIEIMDMNQTQYQEFLQQRRLLMAQKIRKYYQNL